MAFTPVSSTLYPSECKGISVQLLTIDNYKKIPEDRKEMEENEGIIIETKIAFRDMLFFFSFLWIIV